MKDRRKNRTKRKMLFALYLSVCLAIIVAAYFHLSRIALNFNTQNLELITGLYAEKMNETVEYLQSYTKEDSKMIQVMDDTTPDELLSRLNEHLNRELFCSIGFVTSDGVIYGNEGSIADIKKKQLDQIAATSNMVFTSEPYLSSETGTMVLTIFVPVEQSSQIHTLYTSIMIEDLKKLAIYDLLRGKVSVHLLKADSENFITCISDSSTVSEGWNNLLLQQKYFSYNDDYSYNQWIKDMRSGKKEGRFSAKIKGEDTTISYRSISGMPGWYVFVTLTNKNISNITQHFSVWGGVYGSILVGFTILYMLTILLLEKKDKKKYMGLSNIDALTGILNRRAFQTALEAELSSREPGFFVFIDVDNFKLCNDTYGHNNGDLCLRHFSDSMKKCFPADSLLGRYGGDEFVAYIKTPSADLVQTCMQQFQQEIHHLTLPTGEDISLSASAGGAAFPAQGEDFISLCRSADAALYHVKQNGKAHFYMS